MQFSPTKLLQGLLYTAPIVLLTLAACGGGGSSDAPLTQAYTVGGAVSGVSAAGLVLRNNGGDDKAISTVDATYTFSTSVISGTSYNVTVLTNPSNLKCSIPANASGMMPAYNITNANVSCDPAFTIGGTVSGVSGTVVLQNNGADNLLLSANGSFTFSTPVAAGGNYLVTVLTQPDYPARQICTPTINTGSNINGAVSGVLISCSLDPTPSPDRYVYAVNNGSTGTNGVSSYVSTGGVLSTQTYNSSGSGPYSIAVDPASKYVYVANYNSDSISAYSIGVSGVLAALPDVDGGTNGTQTSIATGDGPRRIVIHPSGKFAYAVNYLSNNVSAYSIDAATGALAKIDADGVTPGNQFITTSVGPISITVDPSGAYIYVANIGLNSSGVCGHLTASPNGCISAYSIDAISGALTAINAGASTGTFIDTGITPKSITVDPAGNHVYVTNSGSTSVSVYDIGGSGALTSSSPATTGNNPNSVAIHPGGGYAYVANYADGTVSIYSVNAGTGQLSGGTTVDTGDNPLLTHPNSISVDSSGQYAYVANSGTNDIAAFSITGGTTLIRIDSNGVTPGNPNFAAGTSPFDVTTAR